MQLSFSPRPRCLEVPPYEMGRDLGRGLHIQRQPPSFSPDSGAHAAAAPSFPIVAAFASQWWRVSCLPPFFVAE